MCYLHYLCVHRPVCMCDDMMNNKSCCVSRVYASAGWHFIPHWAAMLTGIRLSNRWALQHSLFHLKGKRAAIKINIQQLKLVLEIYFPFKCDISVVAWL